MKLSLALSSLPLSITSLLLVLLSSPHPTHASSGISLPIVGRPRHPGPTLDKRAGVKSTHNGSTVVTNSYDTVYMCNITLNGAEFEVLIDTGSSDLWVAGDVPNARNLSIPAKVTYAKGAARGFINTASLQFDQFTIPDQAFIDVTPSPENPVEQGVLGLGPSSSSNVRSAVKSSAGDTPLDRIFKQNTTTPNYLTVLLNRLADDATDSSGHGSDAVGEVAQVGQLTVGRLITGLESIARQPKLPALEDKFGIQHWQASMDPNGVIGPDGSSIPSNTSIPGVKPKDRSKLHVIFDTGFTFPQVPREVADAIYGRVPGASFVVGEERDSGGSPGYWRLPCDYELSISFSFGGVRIPIAPLDLSIVERRDSRTGAPLSCMATFREIAPDVADHTKFGAFDMILGMAFLRNVYLLIDFGDFVDGRPESVADPYVQLLPITNTTDAHLDFVAARLGGADMSTDQPELLPPGQGKKSPEPDPDSPFYRDNRLGADDDGSESTPWYRRWYFIAGVSVGGLLALIALGSIVASLCCGRRRRRSGVRSEGVFVPVMTGAGAYRPLGVNHPASGSERTLVGSSAGAAAGVGAGVGAGMGAGTKRPDSPVWDDGEYEPYAPYRPQSQGQGQGQTHGGGYDGGTYGGTYGHAHSRADSEMGLGLVGGYAYQEPRYQFYSGGGGGGGGNGR